MPMDKKVVELAATAQGAPTPRDVEMMAQQAADSHTKLRTVAEDYRWDPEFIVALAARWGITVEALSGRKRNR